MSLVGYLFETDFGWSGLALSERGLRYMPLPLPSRADARRELEDRGVVGAASRSDGERIARLVRRFAAGHAVDFAPVVLDWSGYPEFWKAVWTVMRSIPRGETLSYAQVAELAGHPRAARAAGQASAHNPVPFIVPCHRVLASGGGIGGFGGREDLKVRLLELEGSWPRKREQEVPEGMNYRSR